MAYAVASSCSIMLFNSEQEAYSWFNKKRDKLSAQNADFFYEYPIRLVGKSWRLLEFKPGEMPPRVEMAGNARPSKAIRRRMGKAWKQLQATTA